METLSSPVVARRWLALELRRLRQQRDIAQKDAGRRAGWSGARLSYFENAQQTPTRGDLDRLLDLYEVPGGQREAYYDALERSRDKGWWERSTQLTQTLPDWAGLYIGLEQGATEIREYQPLVVPGLLQTADYTGALIRSDPRPRTRREVDLLVDLRIRRQEILTRSEAPAELSAVIGEGVLNESPANGEVMAAQLQRLIDAAARPNVTVRVLPQGRSVTFYAPGPFIILTFPWQEPDPGIVFLEYRTGAVFLEEFEDLESHMLAFDAITALALSAQESLAMMQEAKERYALQ